MANVGAQLEAAAKAARARSLQNFVAGPQLQSDGSLLQEWDKELFSFTPAWPAYLEHAFPAKDYWHVFHQIHHVTWQAKRSSGGSSGNEVMTGMSQQLAAGDIRSMQNPANTHNIVAKAQATAKAQEIAMQAVQALLFDINRAAGGKRTFSLDRVECVPLRFVWCCFQCVRLIHLLTSHHCFGVMCVPLPTPLQMANSGDPDQRRRSRHPHPHRQPREVELGAEV